MKKISRRSFLELAGITAAAGALAACGSSSGSAASAAGTDSAASTAGASGAASTAAKTNQYSADGLGGYKIGFFYMPTTDSLSQAFHNALDYCAKLTNCEMVYYDMTSWGSEDISTAVETLVSNGCTGILLPIGYSPSLYEYMNDNKIYYCGMTRSYNDEIAKVTDNTEYCCGWVGDLGGDSGINVQNGYIMTKALYDKGCKNIAFVAGSEGETMNDERVLGIQKCAEEFGMNIVANYRGGDFTTGYSDILASFGSQLDGIACCGGGSNGVAAIQAAGLSGKIKLVQVDSAGDETRDYLQAGLLTATFSGGSTYMIDLYMQVFNALSGADRLFNSGSRIVPEFNSFIVESVDDWDAAEYATNASVPGGLLPDELYSMNSKCAPGMTVEEREALVEKYQATDYWNVTAISDRVKEYLGD